MELNVHNHSLEEAVEAILYKFEECKECRDNSLKIIHGHKHGTVIKDYIRSGRFLREIAKMENEVIERNFSEAGSTIFKIKLSSTSIKRKLRPELASSKKDVLLEICYKCNEEMTLLKDFNWYKCPKCGKLKKR